MQYGEKLRGNQLIVCLFAIKIGSSKNELA